MINAIVFPYNDRIHRYFLHKSPPNIKINALLTFPCLIPCEFDLGKDVSLTTDYEKAILETDAIIWAEYLSTVSYDEKCKKDVFDIIEYAIENRKTIFCTEILGGEDLHRFEQKSKKYNSRFIYLNNSRECVYQRSLKKNNFTGHSHIPIIFVSGLTTDCDKFSVQVLLQNTLTRLGVKTLLIGSKHYSELFGFHSFPSFMYSDRIGEISKIAMFQNFIGRLVDEEKPDVLVIGIPHGIFNEKETVIDNYGILYYMVSCCFKPDIVFMNIPFFRYNDSFLGELGKTINYRYGHKISCFFASQVMKDDSDDGYDSASSCYLDGSIVENYLASLKADNIVSVGGLTFDVLKEIIIREDFYGKFKGKIH